jgi:hypothetical protein
MWEILGTAAWVISAAIFLWMIWDFLAVNAKYGDEVLVSSREGLDELLPAGDQSSAKKKK